MPTQFATRNISNRFILLGTGTSVGVPTIGCACDVCKSTNPKNARTRCSAIVGLPLGNLLIDTPPDLRMQLLREGIGVANAVLFTHEHADHIFGLDDVRLFPFRIHGPVTLYGESHVLKRIATSYDYAFYDRKETHAGSVPKLELQTIDASPIEILGGLILPIRMHHGPHFEVFGYRIGNIAYCTDTNFIPDESMQLLEGVEYLILDALRKTPHPTHMNVDEALEVIKRVKPRMAYLTHVSHELDYEKTCAELPEGVELAYDGLDLPLRLV